MYLPHALRDAILDRERTSSTALDNGVAFPQPQHPLPHAVGVSFVAYGLTVNSIPFGASGGGLTDIFFLVCCLEADTHIRVLARLARLLRQDDRVGAAGQHAVGDRLLADAAYDAAAHHQTARFFGIRFWVIPRHRRGTGRPGPQTR